MALADKIRSEVKVYQKENIKPNAHLICSEIADAVMDMPDSSFDVVIKHVANNWAMTPDELLRRYPSAKRAFYGAKETIASAKAARTQFDRLISQSTTKKIG